MQAALLANPESCLHKRPFNRFRTLRFSNFEWKFWSTGTALVIRRTMCVLFQCHRQWTVLLFGNRQIICTALEQFSMNFRQMINGICSANAITQFKSLLQENFMTAWTAGFLRKRSPNQREDSMLLDFRLVFFPFSGKGQNYCETFQFASVVKPICDDNYKINKLSSKLEAPI